MQHAEATPRATERPAVHERWLSANGLTQHVLSWGDEQARETVVLCHGFLDLAWGFAELGPRLAAEGYRVLAADFRGHGESGRVSPDGYYYFPDYVLDLHELLPQLIDGSFHLLGHSMGGTVSTMYAATHPERIRSLCLVEGLGPNAESPERSLGRLQSWLEQAPRARAKPPAVLRDLDDAFARLTARHVGVEPSFLRMLAEKSTAPHPGGEGLCWRFDPLHRTSSPLPFDRARFMQCLGNISAPTLVIQGEHGFRGKDHDERSAQLVHVRQATVAGAGHMTHWSQCEAVAALLLEHIGTHVVSSAV